jgi:hypothetical protein
LPVFLGLVGVDGAEFAEGLGEAVAGAEIAGDDERVTGAGVAAGEEFAKNFGEGLEGGTG